MIKTFKKLLNFHIRYIFLNKIIIFFILLASISQPIIVLTLKLTNLNINEYILFVILIPLLLQILLTSMLCFFMFKVTMDRLLETLLISEGFQKTHIFIVRMLIIFLTNLFISIFFVLFNIFILFFNMNSTYLFLFTSNILINNFVVMIFANLFILICLYINKFIIIVINIFILMYLAIPLFLPILKNDTNNIKFDFGNREQTILLVNKKDNNEVIISNNNIINKDKEYKYALLSEWVISFYSSLFVDVNKNNFVNSQYAINQYDFINVKNTNFKNTNDIIALRFQDKYLSKLDDNQLFDLSKQLLNEISSKNKDHSFSALEWINSIMLKLQNEYEWNLVLKNEDLQLVKDLTGINPEYHLFFYLIKYKTIYSNLITKILDYAEQNYNSSIRKLIEYIWLGPSTNYNIFVTNNVLNTNKKIESLYPNILITNETKPINKIDYDFIINDLIRISPANDLMVLTKNKNYQKIDIKILQNISPIIKSFDDWIKYVDNESINYNQTKSLLIKLENNIPDIFSLKLKENYFDLINYPYIYNLGLKNNLEYSNILIGLFCAIGIGLQYLSYNKFYRMQVGKK